MLFDLLLANITILLCFCFYFVLLLIIFYKSCMSETLKLALVIPTEAPMTVANDAMGMLRLVPEKTIKNLPK